SGAWSRWCGLSAAAPAYRNGSTTLRPQPRRSRPSAAQLRSAGVGRVGGFGRLRRFVPVRRFARLPRSGGAGVGRLVAGPRRAVLAGVIRFGVAAELGVTIELGGGLVLAFDPRGAALDGLLPPGPEPDQPERPAQGRDEDDR